MRPIIPLLAALLIAAPAAAQVLGARPGYDNATHKAERQRQQLQAQIHQAERERAAQAALKAEAQKHQ